MTVAPEASPATYPRLVVLVVGPTASGKSDVALDIAERLGGHIVNADAFQVYRGMDIGTAKVPPALRRGIPHHLIDVADFDEEFGVSRYQHLGRDVLGRIALAGRPAVVVGGSGLYVRGLLDDLRFPGSDPVVRARWEAELERVGAMELHRVLAQRDEAAAAAILPTNSRRVVRALEVIEITGEPFQAALPKAGPPLVPHVAIGLLPDLPALDGLIEQRVALMLEAGFLAEVRSLAHAGLRCGSPAGRAIGYAQLLDHLAGSISLGDAVAATVSATRKYARRQLRWFRADPRVTWFAAGERSSTVERILEHIRRVPA